VEGRKKKKFNKNGSSPAGPGVDPRLVGDRWSLAGPGPPTCGRRLLVAGMPTTSGRDLVDACTYWAVPIFLKFFNLKKNEFLEVWEMGQGFWKNGCTAPPFFEACPYTWKC
jgi:hypothetical protein